MLFLFGKTKKIQSALIKAYKDSFHQMRNEKDECMKFLAEGYHNAICDVYMRLFGFNAYIDLWQETVNEYKKHVEADE